MASRRIFCNLWVFLNPPPLYIPAVIVRIETSFTWLSLVWWLRIAVAKIVSMAGDLQNTKTKLVNEEEGSKLDRVF